MDFTTLIILGIIVLAVLFLMRNRRTPATMGGRQYDEPNIRSGGSIGGPGVYDTNDTNVQTAAPYREYNAPEVRSGGSIGGGTGTTSASQYHMPTTHNDTPTTTTDEERRYNSPNVRSGGSIGGGS